MKETEKGTKKFTKKEKIGIIKEDYPHEIGEEISKWYNETN